jgi:glycosyltransferase involved in cell wall biosynthesis
MDTINLSIVICAYNEEKNIGTCLSRLFLQVEDSVGIEVIVINNESQDRTCEFALIEMEKFPRVQSQLVSIAHCPLTSSRNTGLSLAKGKYIAYIDADGWVDDEWLVLLKNAITQSFDVYVGRVKSASEGSNDFSNLIFNAHFYPSLAAATIVPLIGANMAFNATILKSVKGFHQLPSGRGDETLLMEVIQKKFSSINVYIENKSYVFNSYPETFSSWVRTQCSEGQSGGAINNHSFYSIKSLVAFALKLSNILAIPFVIFHIVFPGVYMKTLMLMLIAGFILRHAVRYKYYMSGVSRTFKKFGFKGLLKYPVVLLGSFFLDAYSLSMYFKVKKQAPILAEKGEIMKVEGCTNA